MATTGRSERPSRKRRAEPGEGQGASSPDLLGRAQLRHVLAVAVVCAVVPPSAHAQRWTIEPGISSQLTWTSNSLLGTGSAQDDTIFEIRPRITIRGEGARLRVSGTAALNGVAYLGGTQPSRVLPEGDLGARLEAVERWLYLEASARATQTGSDPFGVRPDPGTTANTLTTTQGRFSPVIEAPISPLMRYRIRSDNIWTNQSYADSSTASTAPGAAGYFGQHTAMIEQDPRPLGWRLEAERDETRYRDGVTTPLVTELARLVVDYAVSDELALGVRGGYERNNYLIGDGHNTIYGGQAKWRPSARTLLSADGERHFFGSAWRLGFDHRTPQLAFSLALSRGVQSTPQSLFQVPATGNVAALLDAMFTTRIPDPAERARVVQKLIADQGLPNATLGPTSIYSQRLSLVTARGGSLGFIGVRNSLVLSAFDTRTEDVPDAAVLATGLANNNNRQYGGGLTFSHRLGVSVTLAATLDWSRIRALDPALPDKTTQRGARLQVNLQASPNTAAVLGVRYRKIDSNVAIPGREGTVYTGLDHRF